MKKGTVRLILLIFIVFILYNCVGMLRPDVKTQIVRSDTMEKSYSLDGIIARNETLIKAPEPGVLESRVKENEYVKKDKVVASIYKGNIDDESQKKLSEINQRINELTAQTQTDTHNSDARKLESVITSKINDIIIAANARDAGKVASLKENLETLSDKKAISGGAAADTASVLGELKSQKEYYEKQFDSSKTDIISPIPGVYSTNIDGYEEALSSDKISELTVSDYQIIRKNKVTKESIAESGAVCKIIDNYQWSAAALVSGSIASQLEVGMSVYIRFSGTSQDVPATISHISPQESGKYAVSFTSTESSEYAMSNRFAEFDLIFGKYTGLKVPVNTISVRDDGKTGVYVLENSMLKFKEINVLYKDGKYAIAEQNNTKSGYLLMYDEVVTYAKDYTEGKKIN